MSISSIIDNGNPPLSWTNLNVNSIRVANGKALSEYEDISQDNVTVTNSLQQASLRYCRVGKIISLTIFRQGGVGFTANVNGFMGITAANMGIIGSRLSTAISSTLVFAGSDAAGQKIVEIRLANTGDLEFQFDKVTPQAGDTILNFAIVFTTMN